MTYKAIPITCWDKTTKKPVMLTCTESGEFGDASGAVLANQKDYCFLGWRGISWDTKTKGKQTYFIKKRESKSRMATLVAALLACELLLLHTLYGTI